MTRQNHGEWQVFLRASAKAGMMALALSDSGTTWRVIFMARTYPPQPSLASSEVTQVNRKGVKHWQHKQI
jgi:collagenase-like PrtC family protease